MTSLQVNQEHNTSPETDTDELLLEARLLLAQCISLQESERGKKTIRDFLAKPYFKEQGKN